MIINQESLREIMKDPDGFMKENRRKDFIVEGFVSSDPSCSNGWWLEDDQIKLNFESYRTDRELNEDQSELEDKISEYANPFIRVKGSLIHCKPTEYICAFGKYDTIYMHFTNCRVLEIKEGTEVPRINTQGERVNLIRY